MARYWTCGRCKQRWPRTKQRCPDCNRKRPAASSAAHRRALDKPYEWYVARFGERCGICGKEPTARRLDRDHDHKTGEPRGLLCHRCNRDLGVRATEEWLERALDYVRRGKRLARNA